MRRGPRAGNRLRGARPRLRPLLARKLGRRLGAGRNGAGALLGQAHRPPPLGRRRFQTASGRRLLLQPDAPGGDRSVKAKLLLVEDEEGLVLTLNDLLVSEGYEVVCERDGVSGEKRAIEEPFDLMLLDLSLPGKNGFDILKDIRARGSSLPVLVLTARSATADKVVGLRLGADD